MVSSLRVRKGFLKRHKGDKNIVSAAESFVFCIFSLVVPELERK